MTSYSPHTARGLQKKNNWVRAAAGEHRPRCRLSSSQWQQTTDEGKTSSATLAQTPNNNDNDNDNDDDNTAVALHTSVA